MEVAREILAQLGGKKFIVMTGAKDFIGDKDRLMFRLPGSGGFCKNGINRVRIVLDASDTYTVEFFKIRGVNVKTIAKVSDVYNDNLREVFQNHTGLYVSL